MPGAHDRTDDLATRAGRPPLGYISVGLGVLSLILAPTYFFSLYAYLAAVPALALGFITRTDERTRRTGTAAEALSLLAALVATAVLVST